MGRFVNFIAVGFQAMMLSMSRYLSRKVRQFVHAQTIEHNFSAAQRASMEGSILDYQEKIVSYLKATRNAAQFGTHERMFSWWHIFHIPLVYVMFSSALYHVYAVHAF